ncbi:DUF5682 family protein [Streptomyces axinellae]|uniref:Uncharacterized protein n=1 Tax=Streptomyces axinellae TaxID=552788 RepID=A0ABP6D1N0_9ACTN
MRTARGPLLMGVRHHGPGSARAVRATLESYAPRIVLIEGPSEADAVAALAADEGMVPPVALLAHAVNEPGRAAFWPLAEFSPEWVALRWAAERGVPVRFIDLPAAHSLALSEGEEEGESEGEDEEEKGRGQKETIGPADRAKRAGDEPGPGETGEKTVPDGADGGGAVGDTDTEEKRDAEEEERGAGPARTGGDAAAPGTATDTAAAATTGSEDGDDDGTAPGDAGTASGGEGAATGEDGAAPGGARGDGGIRLDPVAALAEAAGYDDPERWWEDAVEHRGGSGGGGQGTAADPYEPFAALGEAMAELRARHGDGGHRRDLIREAHMRLRLREARKEFGDAATAVICGAWHVPALTAPTTATADRRMLKGLPKVKAEVTWVPWTHRRLARRSGYGAGIASPGWYGHLFAAPDKPVARWLVKVAGLLRDQDYAVSSAHVIEAVRLAETLAVMRGRPLAGLTETTDAARAVLCDGSDVPMGLIHDQLTVGDVLGEVPEGAPAVPLHRDLAREQRSVRLKPAPEERELDLDLRKQTDSARSRLLHRLRLLGIGWGEPSAGPTGSTGTFRESWRLCWQPELAVRVAEAGVWGTTVYEAATVKARAAVAEVSGAPLTEVTALAERCLLAELPDALPVVMRVLADRAALEADVGHLAQALPALVRTVRYGDVRGTDAGVLVGVAGGMAERVCVGLPPACARLDADGAREMRGHLDAAHHAVNLLARDIRDIRDAPDAGGPQSPPDEHPAPTAPDAAKTPRAATAPAAPPERVDGAALLESWRGVLRTLAIRDRIPGLIRGRCTRLLLDDGQLADEEAARLMSLALSPGTPPADAAAWIEGFLAGGGMLLVHDERLLALVDSWLTGVSGEAFTDVLPLLRRTFAEYETGVRRSLGELVRRGPGATAGSGPGAGPRGGAGAVSLPGFGPGLDADRADAVLTTVSLLLGGPARAAHPPGATAPAPAGTAGGGGPASPVGRDKGRRRAYDRG